MKKPQKKPWTFFWNSKDDSISLYKGTVSSAAPAGGQEKVGGIAKLKESGIGDGRVMAVDALTQIGVARVRNRNDIRGQLKSLAAQAKDDNLKEKAGNLLSKLE